MAASGGIRRWKVAIFLLLASSICFAWDNDELELFDLVEEINQNFYDVLGVQQNSESVDIRRAYRRLSLQLHPDKNDSPDAEEKFRQLVAVYEVLKNENRRKQYDLVLQNGLPDWRMPVFYYRRVRKMGLLELGLLLFVIISIGHYLVVWSVYFERKFTMEEIFSSTMKKKERKSRKKQQQGVEEVEEMMKEELDLIPRPQLKNILPLQCVRLLVHLIVSFPAYCCALKDYVAEQRARRIELQMEEEEEELVDDDKDVVKKVKKRRKVEIPEYSRELYEQSTVVSYNQSTSDDSRQDDSKQIVKTGEWSDDEIGLLAKAVAKFPGGTQDRWEKVAEMVGRTASEVIAKSKSLKGSHLSNIDPSLQGTTGISVKPVSFKSGKTISDDIISTYLPENENDLSSKDSVSEPQARQRSRFTKTQKVADRTSTLSKPSTEPELKNKNETSQIISTKVTASTVVINGPQEDSNKVTEEMDLWTQNQQMILEWALRQHPKATEQRWEKIAEHIPGKTKEDCVARFKHLAELVKKKKSAAS